MMKFKHFQVLKKKHKKFLNKQKNIKKFRPVSGPKGPPLKKLSWKKILNCLFILIYLDLTPLGPNLFRFLPKNYFKNVKKKLFFLKFVLDLKKH